MDFSLTEEQKELRKHIKKFAKEEILPRVFEMERNEQFPRDLAERIGSLGYMGGTVSEQYGGTALDYVTFTMMLEEFAYVEPTAALITGWPSCSLGRPILEYGTEEQKQRYLTPLAQGKKFGAVAITEAHSGTDIVRNMETTVVKKGNKYVINGSKIWISNASQSDFFLAYATLDKSKGMHGITGFLVDKNSPGLTINPIINKVGARTQEVAEVIFDNVEVPQENLMGKEGEGYKLLMCGVEIGRLACAARAIGIMQACLDASVNYAKQREVFNQPIGKFQLIQAKIANMRVSLDAARFLTYRLAWLKDQGVEKCQEEASIAKLFSTDALMKCAEDAYQIHGAYGVAEEYHVGRYFRDAKILQIYDGNNEQHMQIIGEWELGYRFNK